MSQRMDIADGEEECSSAEYTIEIMINVNAAIN
jgi:hypothetical protein